MEKETSKPNQSQKILDAAYKCISTQGYANVSLRDIASEAGVVLSQLTYYYKNKEGLFSEVINVVTDEMSRNIEMNLKQGGTMEERVNFLISHSQKLITGNPELLRMMLDFISMSIWSEPFRKQLSLMLDKHMTLIEKYISNDIVADQNVKGYSSSLIARMVHCMLFGIAMQYIISPEKEGLLDCLNVFHELNTGRVRNTEDSF